MNGMIKTGKTSTRLSELILSNDSRDKKGTGQGLRVLIEEDHEMSRYCLEGFLKKHWHRVSSMACGEDGLDRLGVDRYKELIAIGRFRNYLDNFIPQRKWSSRQENFFEYQKDTTVFSLKSLDNIVESLYLPKNR